MKWEFILVLCVQGGGHFDCLKDSQENLTGKGKVTIVWINKQRGKKMKTAKKRVLSIVFSLVLIMSTMFAVTFNASATTYPIGATVHFITTGVPSTITIIGGETKTIDQYNITKTISYTDSFATVIPGATTSNHGLMGTPSGLDAIYSCYGKARGTNTNPVYTGWNNGWDTDNTPSGSYVDKMFDIPQYTKSITYNWTTHLNTWDGYAWLIFVNTDQLDFSWDDENRTGLLPYYASNFELQDGDVIYCRYLHVQESWYDE